MGKYDKKNIKNSKNDNYKPPFISEFNSKKANVIWHYIDRVAYSIKFIAKIYEKRIGETYRKEREYFNLNDSKKILHIGCGFYPITAMILAEMDGTSIVTIDKKERSVNLAKKFLIKNNLDDKIQAIVGDGTKYPLDEFDTIVISGCSEPKIDVFTHVFKNSKSKTKIIIRDSYYDIEKILKYLNSNNHVNLIEIMENKPYPTARWDSFFLIKK